MKWFHSYTVAAIAMGISSGACVMSPHHEEMHSAVTDPVPFSAYATQAGATITVHCGQPSHSVAWQTAGTITASSNGFTMNDETVYPASASITLPASCWDTGWAGATYHTYVQLRQGSYNMFVYDEEGLDCLSEALGDGDGPITAGYACAMENPYNPGQKQTYLALRSNSYY